MDVMKTSMNTISAKVEAAIEEFINADRPGAIGVRTAGIRDRDLLTGTDDSPGRRLRRGWILAATSPRISEEQKYRSSGTYIRVSVASRHKQRTDFCSSNATCRGACELALGNIKLLEQKTVVEEQRDSSDNKDYNNFSPELDESSGGRIFMHSPDVEHTKTGSDIISGQHSAEGGAVKVKRLTWSCTCGLELYDDYVELVQGSLDALEKRLRRKTLVWQESDTYRAIQQQQMKTATSGEDGTPGTQAQTAATSATGAMSAQASSISSTAPKEAPMTPSSRQSATDAAQNTPPSSTSASILYLLVCLPKTSIGVKLHHVQLVTRYIKDDRHLFEILGRFWQSNRPRTNRPRFSSVFRKVVRVSMTAFIADLSNNVDPKPHDGYCSPASLDCKCLPPVQLLMPSPGAEYTCNPVKPIYKPPIGPNHLTHMFLHPQCNPPLSEWVLNQIPKRLAGQLMAVSGSKPVQGWGLVFEEEWNMHRIYQICVIVFVASSLLFAVLWTVLKRDIQGAFGVSAYWLALFFVVAGYYATADK